MSASPKCSLLRVLTIAFLLCSAVLRVAGEETRKEIVASYLFFLEDPDRPVASGIVWLYHYSWYGLHSYKLATIEDGVARINLTVEQLKTEVEPHRDTEAYVLALQLPPNRWYRTKDIAPEFLWRDLVSSLNALGEVKPAGSGETLLVLPAPSTRQLVLQHENGSPAVNLEVPVAIYLYDRNHCGHHVGPPLGTFLTDHEGAIEFSSPPLPLYLDVRFYDRAGDGPAGPAYSAVVGLKVGSDSEIVLRKAWDLPEEELRVQVLGENGHPLPAVSINQAIRTGECGAWWGQVGQTDVESTARFAIAPAATERLWLVRADEDERRLTEVELKTLFREHRLTLNW